MNTETTSIGAFEAKTKLGELLDRVGDGESFTITKHNKPVARLVGFDEELSSSRAKATSELRRLRARYKLKGVNVRALREEGRA